MPCRAARRAPERSEHRAARMTPVELGRARIHRLSASDGGVPKLALSRARVTPLGIEGDRQRYRKIHGGPQRALCLYSLELIERLRAEGHPVSPGSCGENVTVAGIEWTRVRPAARLRLGAEVEVVVTRYTTPCKTIAASFLDGDFRRISQDRHPGESRVYARVLRGGWLEPGDAVAVLLDDDVAFPSPEGNPRPVRSS